MRQLIAIALFCAGLLCIAQAQVPMTGAGLGAPGGAFTPANLTGLLAWYSADSGVFTNVGCSTPATNGQSIKCWTDKSGNGYNLASSGSGDPTFQSTGFNGKQAIQFVAANGNLLITASGVVLSSNTASCFSALFITSSSNLFARIVGYAAPTQNLTGANSAIFYILHNSETLVDGFQNGTFLSEATIVSSTNYRLGSIFDASNNNTVYLNNVAQTPAAATFTFTTAGQIVLGADTNATANYDGSIAEVVCTSTAMSSTDRSNVDAYLRSHWGL